MTDVLPKALPRILLKDVIYPGKFKLMDGMLLLISESGNSELIVYDFLQAVADQLPEAPEVSRFGNEYFQFSTLNLVNFDLSVNLQDGYRSLFLVNETERVCHVQLNRSTY